MNPLPKDFKPTSINDFIGPARAVAIILEQHALQSKNNGRTPLAILINGRPGLGKSALAEYLLQVLEVSKWSRTKKNGTSFKIDTVENYAETLHATDMFSPYRALWIEEADAVPTIAQIRMLTLLDDLPKGHAVILTCNCKIQDFQERLHTRFQVFEVKSPATHEIESLLCRWPLPEHIRKQIAVGCGGNVRMALLDAHSALTTIASQTRKAA